MAATLAIDAGQTNCFQYQPLDLSLPSIRILEVLPALSLSGRIQCLLTNATTDAEYQCLSYCWGPTDAAQARHIIEINQTNFLVLPNLYRFLDAFHSMPAHDAQQNLRKLPIWIDAISLDQENKKERNHQVQQMGSIYRKAASVTIWLGSGHSDSKDTLRRLHLQHESERGPARCKPLKPRAANIMKNGLLALSADQYWTRMWIVPEVMQAKALRIMYDTVQISWNTWHFAHSDALDENLQKKLKQSHASKLMIKRRRVLEQTGGYLLRDLLERFGRSQCADPRDRIFALVGLCREGAKGILKVDYNMSVEALFVEVMDACSFDSLKQRRMLAEALQISHDRLRQDKARFRLGTGSQIVLVKGGNPARKVWSLPNCPSCYLVLNQAGRMRRWDWSVSEFVLVCLKDQGFDGHLFFIWLAGDWAFAGLAETRTGDRFLDLDVALCALSEATLRQSRGNTYLDLDAAAYSFLLDPYQALPPRNESPDLRNEIRVLDETTLEATERFNRMLLKSRTRPPAPLGEAGKRPSIPRHWREVEDLAEISGSPESRVIVSVRPQKLEKQKR